MPNAALLCGADPYNSGGGLGTPNWWSFGDSLVEAYSGRTEAYAQVIQRTAGTYSMMTIYVPTNSGGATATFYFRNNAGNKNQTFVLTSNQTGRFTDSSHTDVVAAGDLVDYQGTMGGSGDFVNVDTADFSIIFNATTTSNTVTRLASFCSPTFSVASTGYYLPIKGYAWSALTTETSAKCRQPYAGTGQYLAVNVVTNTSANNATYATRLSGGAGGLSATITLGATGVYEDTSHTDTITVGSDYNFLCTTGASTVNMRPINATIDFISTAKVCQLGSSMNATGRPDGAGGPFNHGVTNYQSVGGECEPIATEAPVQTTTLSNFIMSYATINILTNSVGATSNFNLRKNTAATTLSASITASTTGVYQDSTHTVAVITTDLINTQLVVGVAASGSVTHCDASVWATGFVYNSISISESSSGTVTEVLKKMSILSMSEKVVTATAITGSG